MRVVRHGRTRQVWGARLGADTNILTPVRRYADGHKLDRHTRTYDQLHAGLQGRPSAPVPA